MKREEDYIRKAFGKMSRRYTGGEGVISNFIGRGMPGLLYFPGNENFAKILTCDTVILCEIAAYYFILYCLHHWVPGRKYPALVIGRFAGVLLSLISAGPIFTVTFLKYFDPDPDATSVVLVFFIILSFVLAFSIYRQPTGGNHGDSQ